MFTGEDERYGEAGFAIPMRHYLDFFEAEVVRDPASWSFLGDRRWRWVLDDAVRGRDASDGGLVAPRQR